MTDIISDQSFSPFILLDLAILEIPLTTDAFRVYVELKRYAITADGCFPSYETLGKCFKGSYPKSKEDLHCQKAIAAVNELVEWGLVKKVECKSDREPQIYYQYVLTSYTEWKCSLDIQKLTVVLENASNTIQLSGVNSQLDLVNSLPTSSQQEEGEESKNFGFQIAEVKAQPIVDLPRQLETKQLQAENSVTVNITPSSQVQIKYDPALGIRPPRQRAKYRYPYGPWLNEVGQIRKEFIRDRANLWRTGDTPKSKAFGAMAIEDVEGLVCDHYANPMNHSKLENDWNAFLKKHQRYINNVQQRLSAGMTISEQEQQKILSLAPAFSAEQIESAYGSSKEIKTMQIPEEYEPQQLELSETLVDENWDTVEAVTLEQENSWKKIVPEGAENATIYAPVKTEQSDYFRELAEKQAVNIKPVKVETIRSVEEARARINALIACKGIPAVSHEERERMKEQDKQSRKLAHWNALLQSGIPSVIADVERQARAQGYVIIDGQVSDVEF